MHASHHPASLQARPPPTTMLPLVVGEQRGCGTHARHAPEQRRRQRLAQHVQPGMLVARVIARCRVGTAGNHNSTTAFANGVLLPPGGDPLRPAHSVAGQHSGVHTCARTHTNTHAPPPHSVTSAHNAESPGGHKLARQLPQQRRRATRARSLERVGAHHVLRGQDVLGGVADRLVAALRRLAAHQVRQDVEDVAAGLHNRVEDAAG